MKGVEVHLGGRLTNRLGRNQTDHFTWIDGCFFIDKHDFLKKEDERLFRKSVLEHQRRRVQVIVKRTLEHDAWMIDRLQVMLVVMVQGLVTFQRSHIRLRGLGVKLMLQVHNERGKRHG